MTSFHWQKRDFGRMTTKTEDMDNYIGIFVSVFSVLGP